MLIDERPVGGGVEAKEQRVGPHQAQGKEGSKQGILQTPAVSLRRGAIDDPIN